MSSLKSIIEAIQEELIESNCKLIAVSKTKPIETIQEAYDLGLRVFGENKVQELNAKYEALPKDIKWHYIGHLQTNKVKYIAPFISLIHAVDSLKLLKEINKRAKSNDRIINCLFQLHIAQEDTKFGLDKEELIEIINHKEFQQLENISMQGLMGMATYTDNQEQIHTEFKKLTAIFDYIKSTYTRSNLSFKEISMGMSGDYQIAIQEGSTLIRLGSIIFGNRQYT